RGRGNRLSRRVGTQRTASGRLLRASPDAEAGPPAQGGGELLRPEGSGARLGQWYHGSVRGPAPALGDSPRARPVLRRRVGRQVRRLEGVYPSGRRRSPRDAGRRRPEGLVLTLFTSVRNGRSS